ncbi:MAG: ABC transporter permease subunit [Gemmatimonadales bacterium]
MIGTLFRRNLRHHARLLVAVALGLAVAEILFIQVAAALDSGPGFGNIVRMLPGAMQSLFGSQMALATFTAAVAFGFQHPVIVMAATAFVVVACTIPAGERERGVLDLLLARPLARWQYLLAAVGVALVGIIVLPAALFAGLAIGLATVQAPGELGASHYLVAVVELAALLTAFAGLVLLLSVTAARRGPAVARSVGLIVGLYLLDVFGERLQWLAWFRWLSPLRYFRPVRAVVTDAAFLTNVAVLVAAGLLLTAAAFVWFERSDASGGRW